MPKLLPVLDKYRIVSARTRYERFYPGQPLCWKAAAFAHEVNELYEASDAQSLDSTDVSSSEESSTEEQQPSKPSSITSISSSNTTQSLKEIVSFGDSMEERTAVRIVSEQLQATPKSVMFIGTPTPSQIIGQLNMLTNHMKFVCYHGASLDVEISIDQAERCAASYLNKRHSKLNLQHGDSFHLAEDLAKMLIQKADAAANNNHNVSDCNNQQQESEIMND